MQGAKERAFRKGTIKSKQTGYAKCKGFGQMDSQYLFIYQTPVTWQAGALLSAGNINLPEDTGI